MEWPTSPITASNDPKISGNNSRLTILEAGATSAVTNNEPYKAVSSEATMRDMKPSIMIVI